MSRDNGIALVEMGADADSIGLLTRVQVRKPRYLTVHDFCVHPLFEFANRLHGAIGVQEGFLCNGHVGSPWMF